MGSDFKKIQEGDVTAFRQFFKDFYPSLCFFSNKILHDEAAAKDIVQEAFICLWNKKNDIYCIHSAKSYLFKFVKNRSLNYLRDNHSKSKVKPEELDNNYSYHDFAIENETYCIINSAIQTLSPREKQVIELILDGFKNPEIANQLDVSINTIKTLKSRAFKTLRTTLNGFSFQLFSLFYPEIFN